MALSALGGYFDESERKDGSEPISVAGYVFKPKSYEHFSRKRARMLASAGPAPTPYFHMTELYARDSDGIYAGWSVEQRAEVLRQAVDAVRKHTYCGVSVLLSQSEFEAVRRSTRRTRTAFKRPTCWRGSWRGCSRRAKEPYDDGVRADQAPSRQESIGEVSVVPSDRKHVAALFSRNRRRARTTSSWIWRSFFQHVCSNSEPVT